MPSGTLLTFRLTGSDARGGGGSTGSMMLVGSSQNSIHRSLTLVDRGVCRAVPMMGATQSQLVDLDLLIKSDKRRRNGRNTGPSSSTAPTTAATPTVPAIAPQTASAWRRQPSVATGATAHSSNSTSTTNMGGGGGVAGLSSLHSPTNKSISDNEGARRPASARWRVRAMLFWGLLHFLCLRVPNEGLLRLGPHQYHMLRLRL